MAAYEVTATKPVRGQNPYWAYARGGLVGTDSVKVIAGKVLQVDNIWQPVHIDFSLTTDATVANRNMRIRHILTGVTMKSLQSVAVAASLSKKMCVSPLGENLATDVGLDSDYDIPLLLPDSLIIFGEDGSLQFDINTGKAGDTWLFHIVLKYMNYELGMEDPYGGIKGIPERFD